MYIPDEMILGIHDSTRPLVIRRNSDGSFRDGFVMRPSEFVTSMEQIEAVQRLTAPDKHRRDDDRDSDDL